MTKLAKRIAKNNEGIDRQKFYGLEEAVKLIKGRANAKFNETVEIAMNLGVDPRHSDQMVRGVVNLPNGTGRNLRVGVFAKGAKAEEAKKAGAEVVGAEDLFGADVVEGVGDPAEHVVEGEVGQGCGVKVGLEDFGAFAGVEACGLVTGSPGFPRR